MYGKGNAFHFKKSGVLFDQCVTRCGQNSAQGGRIERIQVSYHGQTAQQFRNQSKGFEIGGIHITQQVTGATILFFFIDIKTDGIGVNASGDDTIDAVEGTATDK